MHGTILVLLKRYITVNYDFATWHRFREAVGLNGEDFEVRRNYPDDQLYALMRHAATTAGISPEGLMEKFGEFLVPDLIFMYRKLVDPSWNTLDFLENTERRMHTQARADMAGAAPPVLSVERLSPTAVKVQYVSARRMGALAVGIVRGLANHYGELETLRITPTTREDGEHVEILVERN